MIQFLDPRAAAAAEQQIYDLRIDLDADSERIVVGLLANGFPDSVAFLDAVGAALRERHPAIELRRFDKGNASITAPDGMLDGITKECKAVVAAYGH